MNARRPEGQTLVLFALVLTVLIGFSALVIDIGWKYASERQYQAVADAAALAGAQDLQTASRSALPGTTDKIRARTHALQVVLDQMVGPGLISTCDVNNDISDCDLVPGSAYQVSIRTPALTCVDCDVNRAVEVTVREPQHPLTFARVFGQTTWNLSRTSVAGLVNAPNYTIVALRPVRPSGASTDVKDIKLAGGAHVVVIKGDVGTNSNMDYAACTSLLDLQPDYNLYYADSAPSWGCPNPPGNPGAMIPDPNYPVPAQPATTTYSTRLIGAGQAEDTAADCQALVNAKIIPTTNYEPLVPRNNATGAILWDNVHCMNPGTYNFKLEDNSPELTILKPGLYWFNFGLDVQSNLIGGYDPAEGGVTLWFRRDPNVLFKQRSGTVALNGGSRFSTAGAFNPGGTEPATAPAMTGGIPNLKITVIVQKDPNCQVALPYNAACDDNSNKTIDLAGGTALYLAGVQYAPSDNAKISGNSSGVGYIGQIWAWTLYYNGNNTTLTQEGQQADKPGIMRIDTACSPGEPQTLCH